DVQLAEGRYIVEPRIGPRVGDHDEAFANQNSAAIGHARVRTGWENAAAPRGALSPFRENAKEGRPAAEFSGLVLPLVPSLIDPDPDLEVLAAAAEPRAPHRCSAQVIQSHRDAQMRVGSADPVGRIER